MDVAKPHLSPRPEPLRFMLPDSSDTVVEIPPVTLDQARLALRLDPAEGHRETGREEMFRLHDQAVILLGPKFEYLCGVLQPVQMREVLAAIYRAACNPDPARYARDQIAARQSAPGAYDLLRHLEGVCIELATALGKSAAEIGAMPLRTAIELCEEYRRADAGNVLPPPAPGFTRQ